MWPRRIKSRSFLGQVVFAPSRGHSVTVNCHHSRNTKGTSVVSVPRREGVSRPSESAAQQRRDVPGETAISARVEQMTKASPRLGGFSTEVRSVLRNQLSERCVSSVPSLRELRTRQLRMCAWRTSVPSSVSAYPPASPKSTLAGVFERMKRAARTKKFACISERLAPQSSV